MPYLHTTLHRMLLAEKDSPEKRLRSGLRLMGGSLAATALQVHAQTPRKGGRLRVAGATAAASEAFVYAEEANRRLAIWSPLKNRCATASLCADDFRERFGL